MASDVPNLSRGQRMQAGDRERVGADLLEQYNAGRSIRELCADTGYSIGRVRRLLDEAGVTYRSRGGATRRRSE